jgi:hypothetical protein
MAWHCLYNCFPLAPGRFSRLIGNRDRFGRVGAGIHVVGKPKDNDVGGWRRLAEVVRQIEDAGETPGPADLAAENRDIGQWVIHWTSPEGRQGNSALQTTRRDALIAASRLRRNGAVIRLITGPKGRIITRGEVKRFIFTHPTET